MHHDIVDGIERPAIVIVDEMVGFIWRGGRHVDYRGGLLHVPLLTEDQAAVGVVGPAV